MSATFPTAHLERARTGHALPLLPIGEVLFARLSMGLLGSTAAIAAVGAALAIAA